MKNSTTQKKMKPSLNSNSEIRTVTQLWEAAIAYYEQGDFDTYAMRNIYKRMNPKITFQDIANVISSVYADTYWADVQMDYAILSKNMVQSLGLSRSQADTYAQSAMQQWRGNFSRNNISDTGLIPSQGSFSQSLDIVCNQDTLLEADQLIENWNNEFWKTPSVGKNYVYVRTQNKDFNGDLNAKAQMYYTTGGFNQAPSSWIQCLTVNNQSQDGDILLINNEPGLLGRGDRGASEAFSFTPKSADHVCVIAAVSNQYFTSNTPLGVSSNWDSAIWITHDGSSVWHNVNPQTSKVTNLKVNNQDGTNENFVLSAQCRNVPNGTKVKIETKDKKFSSDEIVIHKSSQFIETEASLPGYYHDDLHISIEGPDGKLLPTNAAIEFTLLWKLHKGHDLYTKASVAFGKSKNLLNDQSIYTSLGSYTIRGA
jgi:hypothetical protein